MIVAKELRKSYRRKHVLTGITFAAREGEVTLLVGPNGAGKSTTLKIFAGLATADAGDATIAGYSITSQRLKAQRALSFLPQMPNFHPRFSCAQILDFYARLRGTDRARCAFALESAGLAEVADQSAGTLSGGMRQRLGLAL
ncbi:MAG: ATP-binding cassette domain-containing protein, partial [Chthoniobacteraceae bacterium]